MAIKQKRNPVFPSWEAEELIADAERACLQAGFQPVHIPRPLVPKFRRRPKLEPSQEPE
jgi:hypothetical protein